MKLPTWFGVLTRHTLGPLPRPAVGVPPDVRLAVLMRPDEPRRDRLKSAEEIMEILEAYDLTGSFRDAAELAGCSHHTIAAHVAARDAGDLSGRPAARRQLIDEYLAKVEEWVEQSSGKIRGDKAKALQLSTVIDFPKAR